MRFDDDNDADERNSKMTDRTTTGPAPEKSLKNINRHAFATLLLFIRLALHFVFQNENIIDFIFERISKEIVRFVFRRHFFSVDSFV